MAKMRLYRALLVFGRLQAVTNLGFQLVVPPASGKSYALMVNWSLIGAGEPVRRPMGTAAYVALLYGALCDRPSFPRRRYALLSAHVGGGPRLRRARRPATWSAAFGWTQFSLHLPGSRCAGLGGAGPGCGRASDARRHGGATIRLASRRRVPQQAPQDRAVAARASSSQ
jgi:PAT family beta-lactamase induction signal transducer AmpG